jgi:DNA-binding transcriptional regulator PaaX
MDYSRLHPEDRRLIQSLLAELKAHKSTKSNWGKISDVKLLTGFSTATITRMRKAGTIQYKRENNQIFYNLQSLPTYEKPTQQTIRRA